MPPTRRQMIAAAATVTVAGCLTDDDPGQGDPTGTDTPTATGTEPPAGDGSTDAAAATLEVRTHDEYGDILVGPDGMTLYMFDQDTEGTGESSCTGGCAETWPPLTVSGDVEAGTAVAASLSTFERADGSRQVAADGWPLYYYAQDDSPGDAAGQGVGGVWWVLAPDGTPRQASSTPTATATGTDTSGGGGGDDDGGVYSY